MELALGTVQFGLRYGVAGPGAPVPEEEVRAILRRAHALGIRMLDTAAAYGDIEVRLLDLAGDLEFRVVTKLPPVPECLKGTEAAAWARTSLCAAELRLGRCIEGVMFHRSEDLLDAQGPVLWEICSAWAADRGVRLGGSCYDSESLLRLMQLWPVTIAQLPGNALDQRLAAHPSIADGLTIHVRSAFLQGLLLMPEAEARQRVPAAAAALARWHQWLRERSLATLPAALGFVKGLRGVSHCVVGVDSLGHLEAIVEAWNEAATIQAPELAEVNIDVIDPRRWPSPS